MTDPDPTPTSPCLPSSPAMPTPPWPGLNQTDAFPDPDAVNLSDSGSDVAMDESANDDGTAAILNRIGELHERLAVSSPAIITALKSQNDELQGQLLHVKRTLKFEQEQHLSKIKELEDQSVRGTASSDPSVEMTPTLVGDRTDGIGFVAPGSMPELIGRGLLAFNATMWVARGSSSALWLLSRDYPQLLALFRPDGAPSLSSAVYLPLGVVGLAAAGLFRRAEAGLTAVVVSLGTLLHMRAEGPRGANWILPYAVLVTAPFAFFKDWRRTHADDEIAGG